MKRIVLLLVLVGGCSVAWCDYSDVLTNMVSALSRRNGTTEATVTNLLEVAGNEVTNPTHRANIDLVRAISFTDISDLERVGDELIPQAVVMCSNVLHSTALPSNAWQRASAGAVLSGIYMFDGKYQEALQTATNAMTLSVCEAFTEEDVSLWGAIANHLEIPGASAAEALRYSAAEALLIEDSSAFVVPYTNGLPELILQKIRAIVE